MRNERKPFICSQSGLFKFRLEATCLHTAVCGWTKAMITVQHWALNSKIIRHCIIYFCESYPKSNRIEICFGCSCLMQRPFFCRNSGWWWLRVFNKIWNSFHVSFHLSHKYINMHISNDELFCFFFYFYFWLHYVWKKNILMHRSKWCRVMIWILWKQSVPFGLLNSRIFFLIRSLEIAMKPQITTFHRVSNSIVNLDHR